MKIEQLRRLKSVSQGCVDMREAQMRADMNRTEIAVISDQIKYETERALQSIAAARATGLITQIEQEPKEDWSFFRKLMNPHGDDRDL